MISVELNKIHHIDNLEGMALLPEKCAQLIIADPPYFEVKGEFDFIWKSFDEYLAFMEEQAKAYKRILAENGTLYVYGDSKRIAYVQVIFDKYFGLVNSLVWENTNPHKQQIRFSKDLRSYAPLTERLLMYSNDQYNLTQCVYNIRDYIRATILEAKGHIRFKDINSALGTATNGGGVASACLSTDKAEPAMFTAEMYGKLQAWCPELRREYEELRREYEELRREYEELRRPFNNFNNFGDVIHLPNFETCAHDHETIKPSKLCNCLVLTSSRKGDLVVIPFAGSGSECVAAKKKGRKFIGFETTLKYVDMANERVRKETAQHEMF